MLKTSNVAAANKAAQNHGAVARAAADQAATVARQYAATGAEQVALGLKVAGSYAVGFLRSFAGK